VAGDYNVIPTSADARNAQAWVKRRFVFAGARDEFRAVVNLGLRAWTQ